MEISYRHISHATSTPVAIRSSQANQIMMECVEIHCLTSVRYVPPCPLSPSPTHHLVSMQATPQQFPPYLHILCPTTTKCKCNSTLYHQQICSSITASSSAIMFLLLNMRNHGEIMQHNLCYGNQLLFSSTFYVIQRSVPINRSGLNYLLVRETQLLEIW